MSSEVSISDAFSLKLRIAATFVAVGLAGCLVVLGTTIDYANPPLTSNGPGAGGMAGGVIGPVLGMSILLKYRSDNIDVQGFSWTSQLAIIGGVWLGVYFLASFVLLGIEHNIPITDSMDALTSIGMAIAGVITAATAPGIALRRDKVTIQRVETQTTPTDITEDESPEPVDAQQEQQADTSVAEATADQPKATDNKDEQEQDGLSSGTASKQPSRLEQQVLSAQSARDGAENHLEQGDADKTLERIDGAIETCNEAFESADETQGERPDELVGVCDDLQSLRTEAVRAHTEDLTNEIQQALSSQNVTKATETLREFNVFLNQAGPEDTLNRERFGAELSEYRDQLYASAGEAYSEFLAAAQRAQIESESRLEDGEYTQAKQRAEDGLADCERASTLAAAFEIDRSEELSEVRDALTTLIDRVDAIQSVSAEAETHRERARTELESNNDEEAEQALSAFQTAIEDLRKFDHTDSVIGELETDRAEISDEIAASKAEGRVTGFVGAAMSAYSQAEELVDRRATTEATQKLDTALESLATAAELNEKHGLGRGADIAEKRETVIALQNRARTRPTETLNERLTEAEETVTNGIAAREDDDLDTATEAFEAALSLYDDAVEIATEHELSQQWEVEERRSLVAEYLETTRQELVENEHTVADEMGSDLDDAGSVIVRAEQYQEVDDIVSAREMLSKGFDSLEAAATQLDAGEGTEQQQERYEALLERAESLQADLPEPSESSTYRRQDLVDSLQRLATKLEESPRPEFVNKYGEYPADAYLEAFGSWSEALAAANLDPINEARRQRGMYSRVEVLDAVVDLAEELGHPPSKSEMNDQGAMSASPVESRFADWETALEIAGLEDEDEETDAANQEPDTGDSETDQTDQSKPDSSAEDSGNNDGILGEIEREIQEFEPVEEVD